jgi:hypothetical protein
VRLSVSFGDLHTPRYTLVLGLIVMCMWGGSEGARQRVAVVCLSYMYDIHDKWTVPNMRWCFSTLSVRSGSEVKVGGGIEGVRTTQGRGRRSVGGRREARDIQECPRGLLGVRRRGRTEVGSGLKATTGISRWFPGKHVCLTLLIGTGVSTWKRQRGLVGRGSCN